jgi:hypothetical protein
MQHLNLKQNTPDMQYMYYTLHSGSSSANVLNIAPEIGLSLFISFSLLNCIFTIGPVPGGFLPEELGGFPPPPFVGALTLALIMIKGVKGVNG